VIPPVRVDLVEFWVEGVDLGILRGEPIAACPIPGQRTRVRLQLRSLLKLVEDLPAPIRLGSQCDYGCHQA
jgi:hypothetical protein